MNYLQLTTPQKNIWNLQKYHENTAIANLCGAIFFRERRDGLLLQQSVRLFIQNQSSLRLRFCSGDEPKQYISDEVIDSIPIMEFESREEFDCFAEDFAKEPIGLIERQMYRFVVFHTKNESGILVMLSHLVSDAWTFGMMGNQLDAAYRKLAEGKDFSLLTGDYADFIRAEDQYFRSERYMKDKKYWEEKYDVHLEKSPIKAWQNPVDFIDGKRITRMLPPSLEQKIAEYSKKHSVTQAVLFETALIIYLFRINPDNKAVTVGIPVLNRSNANEKKIAGMFVSTMPLTIMMTEDATISDLEKQITRGHMDVFRHQKYPYANILRYLREKQDFSGNLYDVMISYQNAKTDTGADTKWYSNGCSEVPFILHIDNRDGNDCHTINVDYQTAVFRSEEEVGYIIDRLEYVLEQIMEDSERRVGDINIVPEKELDKVIDQFNDTYEDYPRKKCVHELFSEQAERLPDKVALVFEDEKFTYRQLDKMSNSLAHFLRDKGIKPNDVVPIIANRSWHVIVAMLGILKAGGAYMPITPDYPEDRIANMLEIAKSKMALIFGYEKKISVDFIELNSFNYGYNEAEIGNVNCPDDLAYVIFTSGSTGVPKGICQTHKCLTNLISWQEREISANGCNILGSTIITFDVSVQEIMYSLLNNGCMFFTNDYIKKNSSKYLNYIEKNKISTIFTTPSYFNLIFNTDDSGKLDSVHNIFFAGEKLEIEKSIFKKLCDKRAVLNQYGPAETHVVTNKRIDNVFDVTIGKPIANTQVYILDKANRPLPIGAAGELCIAGDGVGKGYLNRSELTTERFVQNPFATENNFHGKIMYHTGDLACWRADGEIEYLGRIDTQVKVRGLRIELEEIENVMGSMEGIGLTAATDKSDKDGRQYLVGYYTADIKIDEKELRKHLSEKLPKYMIPNYFMRLEVIPMTSSGKIDRRNLPMPDFTTQEVDYISPVTETEKELAKIWQQLLHIETIGKTDDFFELGGDSLLAISMLNEIDKNFHVEISVKEIMGQSILEELAQYVERATSTTNSIAVYHEEKYVLLPQQKAIYAVWMKEPDTLVYNMPARLSLPEIVDKDKLKQSIVKVINHHKLLKSYIQAEGNEIYGIYMENTPIIFEEYRNGEEKVFIRPFDLRKAPLVRIGFTEDALLFDMHHIVSDGASLNIILNDIVSAYGGKDLKESNAEYSDYSRYFYGLETTEHKTFFKEMLKCDLEPILLPKTKKLKKGGESKNYLMPEDIFLKAKEYAKENGLTDTMVFFGVYGILLSKYTGKKDILSSIILQNRIHADISNTVGMFVNTLPIYFTVGDMMQEYMQEVKQLLWGLFRYQELPFVSIADAVGMGDKSVVNTAFVYQGDGEKVLTLDGRKLIPQSLATHTAKFDLCMELTPLGDGCRIRMEYNTEKYDEQLMDNLVSAYLRILEQLGKEKIADIWVLSEDEYYKVIDEFNDTYMDYPREKCVHELFADQVKKTPDKVALIFEDKKFTYRQLDEMSNSLAHALREKGIGKNDVVPIIAKRSWHVIVAILGVLKAGGAYMPVDLLYPNDRVKYMIMEVKAKIILILDYPDSDRIEIDKLDLNTFNFDKNITEINSINYTEDIFSVIFTSGTTGLPKGTILCHKGAVNFTYANDALYANCDYVVGLATISFDAFFLDTICPIIRGTSCVLADEKEQFISDEFINLIKNNKNLNMFCTPTKLLKLLAECKNLYYLKNVNNFCIGGEIFSVDLFKVIKEANHKINIFNVYGPTETTMWTSEKMIYELEDITIGKPIANTQIYILDKDGNPVPIGVTGELCIAGEGVGKGYLNRPELTAERFVPNPFVTKENHHGRIMYHTGDLACWRADGEIEYLGRIDTQVKIRGLRIELGEIENVMGSVDGIRLTAVADKRDQDDRQYLVGYYTAETEIEERKLEKELRRHLSAKLPKYMVPNYLVRLDVMPMTPSGKIDRKNLPAPDFTEFVAEYIAPDTDTEKRLASIWQDLLKVKQVSRDDNFFDIGGDSLLAITELNEIESQFGITITMRDIMENETLSRLAKCIENAKEAEKEIFARHGKKYELTPQQKAIFIECNKNADTLLYNIPVKIRLPIGTDRDKIKECLKKIVSMHSSLRTYFVIEEEKIYGVCDDTAEIVFEEYDDRTEKLFLRPFRLEKAPLMHVGFTKDALLVDIHHIVADGESMNIILKEMEELYCGAIPSREKVSYADYADYFHHMDLSEDKKYFVDMLRCDFEPVTLPEVKTSEEIGGAQKVYEIPAGKLEKYRGFAKRNGYTDTMLFLGAYGILLSKYSGKIEILSSIILSNRTHAETNRTVGMFVNTLPVMLMPDGDIILYFDRVKELVLHLYEHQELPFMEIADAVKMKDKSVVNTSFIYQGKEKSLSVGDEKCIVEPLDTHTAKFDLSMEIILSEDSYKIRMEYNLKKYEEELIDDLIGAYLRVLEQLDRGKIADISVLSENEWHKVIEGFNDTYVNYSKGSCVHELFSEQAWKMPDKIALVFENKKITYKQLDEMSNSLAHFLRENGIKQNDIVPIIAKRSWHVVVAMLGILKAGGAYMQVAPDYPVDRITYMLEIAGSKIALIYGYKEELDVECIKLEEFDFAYNKKNIKNINQPENSAYVIFTSGSTGMPKGVTVCHYNICNYAYNDSKNKVCHGIILNQYECIVSVTNIVFDIFVTESLLPLLNGMCIYFANDTEATLQEALSQLIERNKIDILQTTPTKMKSFLLNKEKMEYLRKLKMIILGGEALPQNLYHELRYYTDAYIYNIYGPAETTVWSTNAEVIDNDITIGKPIANTQIYILDKDNNPLPIGVAGELCIAGDGVGKGYLNHPELTAEHFVPNPFATKNNHHGKTMYHTGDLARWRKDGEIEYLGRIDTQVKIRGLRIELGEIESVMSSMESIGLAAVADKRDPDERQYLVGYYTADAEIEEKELRRHLSEKLPKYMVPNYFMKLEDMPMTPSGKIDRKNLPMPDFTLQTMEYIAPVTKQEKELCHLLEKLLHIERVGITDDFFELGGDSMAAIEYVAKAHMIGIEFTLQNVFDYPTVQLLCNFLEHGEKLSVHYRSSDFDKYQKLFAPNVIDATFVPEKRPLGNVLLTGATGFLGAHILEQLMQSEAGKIYCFVRDGEKTDYRKRLQKILQYYFGNRFTGELCKKIIPVAGDIEQEFLAKEMPKDVQTVIHTAASVKHYGSYDYFNRVNTKGTQHVINYAKQIGARLIHISTLSVSGNSMADDFTVYRAEKEIDFYETSLYVGQPLDNVYIRSKFEAERAVYDAMLEGLDAKVIRVGNLTNRTSDYKFQPNYAENAFLTRTKAILEFGLFPDYLMHLYSEFSPVDFTAEGIVKIAQYAGLQSIFHLYSNRPIYYERFFEVVKELGISMEVVTGEFFYKALQETIRDSEKEYIYEALQNDIDENGKLVYDSNIHIKNDFTVWFLKKIGFEWNETDMEYIRGYIEYFRQIGYLKI